MTDTRYEQRCRRQGAFDDSLGCRIRRHFATEEADALCRSLYGPFVERAFARPSRTARRVSDANMNDHVLDRTREHRRVRKALATLSKQHQQALWLAYGPHAWPGEVEARFAALGQCCGVVLVSDAAKHAFEAEMKRKRTHVRSGRRTTATAQRARLDGNQAAHQQAIAEFEAQLGSIAARLRRAEDPAERAALEEEAVALRARVRKMRAEGPRILPVREAPAEGAVALANLERAERLGVGEWLRGQSAEKHVPAIIAEARELLEAARGAIAEALRAQDHKRTTTGHRTRRAPDVRAEFWPEAAAGEVLLV